MNLSQSHITPDQENDWIRSFQTGDSRGFELLYQKYWKRLFAFVRLALVAPSKEVIEDICQDVMFSIFKNLHQFRFESKFSTYLFAIAIHAVQAHRKKIKLTPRGKEETIDRLVSPVSLEDAVWGGELDRMLAEGLQLLPEKERTVWVLREIEELNWDEIARITGSAVRAAQMQKDRAQIFLRHWLLEKGYSGKGDKE